MAARDPHVDDVTGTETTGHVWDGIRELNTPLPRWWLYVFFATIVASVVYWVLMPSWPLLNGYTQGILGFSDRARVAEEVSALKAARTPSFQRLGASTYDQIIADPQLADFARAAGESAFGDNCATCHGQGGAGAKDYPNLADDVWLWGGTLGDIEHTLRVGIRSTHPETRMSMMPAYGRDRLLTAREISDVTEYVLSISAAGPRLRPDPAAAARGATVFQSQCVTCHGADGAGDRTLGAPSLRDDVWLAGGTRADIRAQIDTGGNRVMPTWEQRLDPAMIRALAVYVYGLGGGERDAPPAAATPAAATPGETPPGPPAPAPSTP